MLGISIGCNSSDRSRMCFDHADAAATSFSDAQRFGHGALEPWMLVFDPGALLVSDLIVALSFDLAGMSSNLLVCILIFL